MYVSPNKRQNDTTLSRHGQRANGGETKSQNLHIHTDLHLEGHLTDLTGCLEIPSTCTPRAASNQRGTEELYVGSVSLVVVLEGQQELVAGEQDDLVLLAVGGPIARNELRFFPVQRQRPRKWRKRVCVYVCVCVCVCAGFLMCRRFFVCIPVSAVSYFCCYPSSTHLTCCASSRRRSAQWRAS